MRRRWKTWEIVTAGLLCSAWLSGCATPPEQPPDRAQNLHETADHTAPASIVGEAAELSGELLYELLLANIAGQRGHLEVAMESLSRAAHLSRDHRIAAQALALAAQLEDYRRIIGLSDLMADIRPGETRHHLMLAKARLATGLDEQALKLLIDLARRQPVGGEAVLQSIALLLAERPPETQLLARFRLGIEAWPQSPELKLTAALLATELEQNEDFRELLDETLKLRPDWEVAAILKMSDLSDFDAQQMPAYADDFLRKFPDAKQFRIRYGELLHYLDQPQKALTQLEIVLRQDPQSTAALLAGGVIYLAQENLPEALARLSLVLALEPRNDRARLYIADIQIEQQAFDSATAVLHEISTPEYYLDVETRLAIVIAKRQGVESGIRHLAEINTRNEAEAVRVILSQDLLYRDFDLLDRAKAVLDAGLEKIPGHPDLLYNRGLLAAQLNLLELHERDMRALIGQQPDNAHAYNALGYTLADQTERLDEAFALITRALEMKPNDPYILDSMGWVNFRIGNNDTAIEFLRRALNAKKNAEIAAHLGEALWAAGKRREAREIWEQGKQWSPDNPILLDTLKRFSDQDSSAAPAEGRRLAGIQAIIQMPHSTSMPRTLLSP